MAHMGNLMTPVVLGKDTFSPLVLIHREIEAQEAANHPKPWLIILDKQKKERTLAENRQVHVAFDQRNAKDMPIN